MASSALQGLIWDEWDWAHLRGEEWTESEEWKRSVVEFVMLPRLPQGSDVLEIGPGAGRWTESLVEIAGSLTLVDISEACIRICRERFGQFEHLTYLTTTGSDMEPVETESIDVAWSWDVFVHLSPHDIAGYLDELQRVLRPGGRAILHHADDDGVHGGWRSQMTREMFCHLSESAGLIVEEQFDTWGDSEEFDVRRYRDMISVISKP